MDETYQTYVNRLAQLTLPATYQPQLQNIQPSPKFQAGRPVSFPGYSAISPPKGEDGENASFYGNLEVFQEKLLAEIEPGLVIPVPPDSFHLTVADLIWESRYQEALKANPHFPQQLKACIKDSFQTYQRSATLRGPSPWQLLGLLVFPRALALALVPQNEAAYEQILHLRRSLYQNPDLIALGIEQQYHFTAHITLGYFNEIPADLDRPHLAAVLSQGNDHWLETEPQILNIKQVELRQFTDMTRFQREPGDPTVTL